ncbi:choice-of-anchor I family protein [Shewanella sp. SR43-8]|uniref:choice-of-anchor I family protein n=1 Tax=Shewanella sp. SR43-8 TaxID=2760938 RepID=UPI0016030338|nr:choice-of-anchor I family protein [Shewanella sp. SR43-8]MBB1323711.1 choice-of-anchor I family protein [Shewanella sp. SR43-8]
MKRFPQGKTALLVSSIMATMLLTACNGDDGQAGAQGMDGINGDVGLSALVALTSLAVGDAQCPFGGQQIETGVDINSDGVLDASEVDAAQTQIMCNQAHNTLSADLVGRYQSGVYGLSAAEIVDYHPASQSAFVVNAQSGKVDVVDLSMLTQAPVYAEAGYSLNNLSKKTDLNISVDTGLTLLGAVNSVSVSGNLLAAAVERADALGNATQGNGIVAFYRLSDSELPQYLSFVDVGALPDNVVFSPDGSMLLVANEGEPNSAYDIDPEGSIALIAITNGVPATTATLIDFNDFNVGGSRNAELSPLIKINGPGASVAQDLEPEYIAVSPDSQTAYVSLQENNAIAVIDIKAAAVKNIIALGLKDFGLDANKIDASDKDDAINIQAYAGVYGMYQPDTIASYRWNNTDFIVTANEGDSRDYAGFSEEARAADLSLDPNHPQFAAAQDKTQLGRLKVTTSMGDDNNDGLMDKIVAYGGRSFSIWTADGQQVFDSAGDFERITAAILAMNFNNNNDENKGDSRSDDKGPEPEALALGQIGSRTYAFIGLERTSGFMIYDITNPFAVSFVDYVSNRNFDADYVIDTDTGDVEGDATLAGDLGPEGMKFIASQYSPTGLPLLLIGNEVSGTTTVYQLKLQ